MAKRKRRQRNRNRPDTTPSDPQLHEGEEDAHTTAAPDGDRDADTSTPRDDPAEEDRHAEAEGELEIKAIELAYREADEADDPDWAEGADGADDSVEVDSGPPGRAAEEAVEGDDEHVVSTAPDSAGAAPTSDRPSSGAPTPTPTPASTPASTVDDRSDLTPDLLARLEAVLMSADRAVKPATLLEVLGLVDQATLDAVEEAEEAASDDEEEDEDEPNDDESVQKTAAVADRRPPIAAQPDVDELTGPQAIKAPAAPGTEDGTGDTEESRDAEVVKAGSPEAPAVDEGAATQDAESERETEAGSEAPATDDPPNEDATTPAAPAAEAEAPIKSKAKSSRQKRADARKAALAARQRAATRAGLATLDKAVEALNNVYDETGRVFRIERVAGGFRVMTLPEYGDTVAKLQKTRGPGRLTQAALETLAIVAYRQPITRADVERIRGVSCGEVLRTLLERKLVKIVGRAEEVGRPMLYGTTRKFLETFGLSSIRDLPREKDLDAF